MVRMGNIGINANFVFSYICKFLLYFHFMLVINVKLNQWVRKLHFQIAGFIRPDPF